MSKHAKSSSKAIGNNNNNNSSRLQNNQKREEEQQSIRKERLDAVFNKALDATWNSFGDGELEECFGEIKGKFGNTMQKAFFNMQGEAHSSMIAGYNGICTRLDVDESLLALESLPPIAPQSSSCETDTEIDPINETLLEIKRLEAHNLQTAILQIESNSKQLAEATERIRGEINTEIAALSEEAEKIRIASQQCP